MTQHRVAVSPLPPWVDRTRLLGDGDWVLTDGRADATLDTARAADVAARLRGVGLDGVPLLVDIAPPLSRTAVRAARTEDARRRRDTTPGFTTRGTTLDDEGRWSLTAEPLAARIGREAKRLIGAGGHVIDAGCGAGGNTIGFARAGLRVTAVEQDGVRLAHARHNAAVCGVSGVEFLHGDAAALLSTRTADLVFLDPPWGTTWSRDRTTLADLPALDTLLPAARAAAPHVWVKLPPSFATAELPGARWAAVFGEADGDRQRVKFVLAAISR